MTPLLLSNYHPSWAIQLGNAYQLFTNLRLRSELKDARVSSADALSSCTTYKVDPRTFKFLRSPPGITNQPAQLALASIGVQ